MTPSNIDSDYIDWPFFKVLTCDGTQRWGPFKTETEANERRKTLAQSGISVHLRFYQYPDDSGRVL